MTDMRTDAELLDAILSEAPHITDHVTGTVVCVSAKIVAEWTGKSVQTISAYRTGQANIPVEFWKAVFARTWDMRIPSLMFPDYCDVEINDRRQCASGTPKSFFRESIEAEGLHHEQVKALCDILADGKVDDLDGRRVQEYSDAFWKHRFREARLHRAILAAYRQYASKAGVQ